MLSAVGEPSDAGDRSVGCVLDLIEADCPIELRFCFWHRVTSEVHTIVTASGVHIKDTYAACLHRTSQTKVMLSYIMYER